MHGVFFKFYGLTSFLVDGAYHIVPALPAVMLLFNDFIRRRNYRRAFLVLAALPGASSSVALGMLPFVGIGLLYNPRPRPFQLGEFLGRASAGSDVCPFLWLL